MPQSFFAARHEQTTRDLRKMCEKLPITAVLDTDTYNEIDDQFALAYALLAREAVDLRAVIAAPFSNDRAATPAEGMRLSGVGHPGNAFRTKSQWGRVMLPKLLGRVTWNHEGEIYTWQSRRYRTSTPVGLKGRALNQRRFSRLNISWSLPC